MRASVFALLTIAAALTGAAGDANADPACQEGFCDTPTINLLPSGSALHPSAHAEMTKHECEQLLGDDPEQSAWMCTAIPNTEGMGDDGGHLYMVVPKPLPGDGSL